MHVSLISDEKVEDLTQGKDYTVNDRQVTLAAPTGLKIKIYRVTTTKPLVGWADASVLRAADMTVQSTQLLHLAEETSDLAQDGGLSKDTADNIWDARYNKIKNLLDPTEPGDAVTLSYITKKQTGLLTQLNATGDSQNNRLIATGDTQNARLVTTGDSQNTRINDTGDTQNTRLTTTGNNYVSTMTSLKNITTIRATEANNSADLAKKWAVSDTSPDGGTDSKSAKTWAEAAKVSASNSASYASASASSATASQNSASSSASSASTATQKAMAAASSASAAATSETNAAGSASAAATSESNAMKSASAANISAGNAKSSETKASASASAAKASENAAASSKSAAATSEENAKTSETNASASKNAAANSASIASAKATASANSASAASTSASNAATSATNAKASETKAASSASAAANSAENAKTWDPTQYVKSVTESNGKITVTKGGGDSTLINLIDTFYPVGSVYISADKSKTKADFPFMAYGTWEEVPSNLCLQTGNASEAGSQRSAGLPNIKGTMFSVMWFSTEQRLTGAYTCERENLESQIALNSTEYDGWRNYFIYFNAANSNPIYGKSNTVQPPAYMVRAWVRTA